MRIELQQVESVVQVMIGKPLAWALYGGGVILFCLALAILRAGRWLIQKREEVTWAK